MWGVKLKKFLIFLLLITALNTTVFSSETDVPFRIISASVCSGAESSQAFSVIYLEFNLRIDPEIKNVTVNSSDEIIEKIILKEGKKLEIYLNEPIKPGKRYVVSLAGIKEIYEGRKLASPTVAFKTWGSDVVISEVAAADTYKALIKNNSLEKKDITLIIAAKMAESLKALKVITEKIESGEEKQFYHTFTDVEGEYYITAYTFSDFSALQPITEP